MQFATVHLDSQCEKLLQAPLLKCYPKSPFGVHCEHTVCVNMCFPGNTDGMFTLNAVSLDTVKHKGCQMHKCNVIQTVTLLMKMLFSVLLLYLLYSCTKIL